MKKKIEIFGRKIPILAVLMALLIVGTASAAVTYFAFSGTVAVTSPFSEGEGHEFEIMLNANDNAQKTFEIANGANTPILVELVTSITADGLSDTSGITVEYCDEDGIMLSDLDNDEKQELVISPGGMFITVSVHTDANLDTDTYTIDTIAKSPVGVDFVGLTSKDIVWQPDGRMEGYVIYDISDPEFDFCIKVNGLQDEEYSLIYYVDQVNRYVNYGGINPSIVIATVEPGIYQGLEGTDIAFLNSAASVGHDLPHETDANSDSSNHDYRGAPDFYKTSTGAKLWLIPTASVDETNPTNGGTIITGWDASLYLYEYELVDYTFEEPL